MNSLASSIVSKDCSASRRVMSDETLSSARRSATGRGFAGGAELFLLARSPAEAFAFPEVFFLGMTFSHWEPVPVSGIINAPDQGPTITFSIQLAVSSETFIASANRG